MSGHHFAPSSASAAAHHEAQLFPHQTHALPHSYHGTVPAQDTPNSYHASATSLHTTPPPHPGLPLSARPISPLMHVPPGQRSFTPTLPGSYSYLHSAAYVSQQPTASLVPKNRPSPIFNPMPHGQASKQALTYNQPNGHLPTYSQKKSPSEGHASYDRGELERQWRPNSLAWRDADGMNA